MLPGLDETTSGPAERRLRDEREIWLTTVRADGQPQASVAGFLWDGTDVLVLSQPGTAKVRNLRVRAEVRGRAALGAAQRRRPVRRVLGVLRVRPTRARTH